MSIDTLRHTTAYYLTRNFLSTADLSTVGLRIISKNKIRRGVVILEMLNNHITPNTRRTRNYFKTLDILTEKYFSIIPSHCVKLIDTTTKIAVELATCDHIGVKATLY